MMMTLNSYQATQWMSSMLILEKRDEGLFERVAAAEVILSIMHQTLNISVEFLSFLTNFLIACNFFPIKKFQQKKPLFGSDY